MDAKQLKVGQTFLVLESPPGIPLFDGTVRGRFVVGETVVYRRHEYNSYDGCYMMFFEPAKDGTERVWIGDYSSSETQFLAQFEKYFQLVP